MSGWAQKVVTIHVLPMVTFVYSAIQITCMMKKFRYDSAACKTAL